MADDGHKKRQKGSWNQGKKYKGNRKALERDYTRKEIDHQLSSEDPKFRYPKKTRTRNMLSHLQNKVAFYTRMAADKDRFSHRFWKESLKRYQKKLKEFLGRAKK